MNRYMRASARCDLVSGRSAPCAQVATPDRYRLKSVNSLRGSSPGVCNFQLSKPCNFRLTLTFGSFRGVDGRSTGGAGVGCGTGTRRRRGAARTASGVVLSLDGRRRIWLCTIPTDMRRSFDGLSAMVRNELGADPTSGSWFANVAFPVMLRSVTQASKSDTAATAPQHNGARSDRLQEGYQPFVLLPWSTGCRVRDIGEGQRPGFHLEVDLGVDVRRVQPLVAKPGADRVDVNASFEEVAGRGVPTMSLKT